MNPNKVAQYKSLHKGLFWGSMLSPLLLVWLPFIGKPLSLIVLVWFFLGFRIIGTKERWVIKMFDDPYMPAESGLRWLPFLISNASPFPTTPVQLDFPEKVLVITKPGKIDDQQYGTMTLEGTISFMFRYPVGDALLKAAKILPDPKNQAAFIDYFQEPVFEEVRTIGGDFVYVDLLRRKGDFAEQVTAALTAKEGVIKTLMDEAGIVGAQVLIKKMDPPPAIMAALPAEEDARLKGRATRVAADAEADRERALGKGRGDAKRSEGEGVRDAQTMLYDMIRKHPENMKIRALFTLSEMAQGPATTIFPIPTNLMDDLKGVMGKSTPVGEMEKVWDTLPKALKDQLMREVVKTLKPAQT
jgi:regulator of protease activity HflC (stomatin/prohibitin superfamily)